MHGGFRQILGGGLAVDLRRNEDEDWDLGLGLKMRCGWLTEVSWSCKENLLVRNKYVFTVHVICMRVVDVRIRDGRSNGRCGAES